MFIAMVLLLVNCYDNKMVKFPRDSFHRAPVMQLTKKEAFRKNFLFVKNMNNFLNNKFNFSVEN